MREQLLAIAIGAESLGPTNGQVVQVRVSFRKIGALTQGAAALPRRADHRRVLAP